MQFNWIKLGMSVVHKNIQKAKVGFNWYQRIFVSFLSCYFHAREPLYSNSAVIAGWLQPTRAETVKKGSIFINILLQKTFFADYCHLYIQPYIYFILFI